MNDTAKAPGALNMILFLLLFLVPAAFTYFSGLLLAGGVIAAMEEPEMTSDVTSAMWTIRTVYLAVCYGLMLIACIVRGRATGRMWLAAFPVVGGVFDLFLAFIPFVPSIMNIIVLAAGIPPPKVGVSQ